MSTESDGKPQGVQKSIPVRDASDGCSKLPDKPMTAAQRHGLARKITAYLKRSGLNCALIGEGGKSPRTLN